MLFEISHKTTYTYAEPVIQSQHLLHLRPRELTSQTVRAFQLSVDPPPVTRTERTDAFGNTATMIEIDALHSAFVVSAESSVETTPPAADRPSFDDTTPWDALDVALTGIDPVVATDVRQYACASALTLPLPELRAFAQDFFAPGTPTMRGAFDLVTHVFQTFRFDPSATDVTTPVEEVFESRQGVCQDFSHLALTCFRAMGVPAKYVSGYLLTHPPPGQDKLEGADATHAWISVWAPETGWVEFDPTNGLVVHDEHIRVAYGRDFQDVSPLTGVLLGGGAHTVDVEVDVRIV